MTKAINRVRNPEFSAGKTAPRNWRWRSHGRGVRWRRESWGGVTITSDDATSADLWSQVLVCKPGRFYRVEAAINGAIARAGDRGGPVLRLQPLRGDRAAGEAFTAAGDQRGSCAVIRAYFQAPPGIRRVRISVGMEGAKGTLTVASVRFVAILEPDATSHPLALPPPGWAQPSPRRTRTVAVYCDAGEERPAFGVLRPLFGDRSVVSKTASRLDPSAERADAVLLPDPSPPPAIRSLTDLWKLSSARMVIISLPAFAKLARGALELRRVEQADDPIHAKVTLSNFATSGFALHDVFPYAWDGRRQGSFTQNQFWRTPELASFCKKHGLETVLLSVCAHDATSDRPICLYKPGASGALFVLDVEPVEAAGSALGEPAVALHLLLSILGRTQTGLGQYTVPARTEPELRSMIREVGSRFEQLIVHDEDVPVERVEHQLVTVGQEDQSFGLTLRSKPVILVRSGLRTADAESVYGAWTWFKQLTRPAPYTCPYADRLMSAFRIAWIPSVSRWEYREGWRRGRPAAAVPMELELDDAAVAGLVDIVSTSSKRVRVLVAEHDEVFERMSEWLPRLFADRRPSGSQQRKSYRDPQVILDAAAFEEEIHHQTLAAGGNAIRIEVPSCEVDFAAHSIAQTDLVATLLEQVIGLHFGLIAVNRGVARVQWDGFSPVAVGEALVAARHELERAAAGVG